MDETLLAVVGEVAAAAKRIWGEVQLRPTTFSDSTLLVLATASKRFSMR